MAWQLVPGHHEGGYPYRIDRLYLDMPCVRGRPVDLPESAEQVLPPLPWQCTITPAETPAA